MWKRAPALDGTVRRKEGRAGTGRRRWEATYVGKEVLKMEVLKVGVAALP